MPNKQRSQKPKMAQVLPSFINAAVFTEPLGRKLFADHVSLMNR